ncbi:MAG: hypothetical protein K9M80_05250 [Candidatus Marinimicrobia bacterium]|nr:hypothetical protein [Candidatus Neomarinimicrobiota bacterium]
MSKKVLRTEEGKKVVIDPEVDPCIYKAPVNPPNTGTSFTRGRDLYSHKAKSGDIYFYSHSWSMWQGEGESFSLLDRDQAIDFLLDKLETGGHAGLSEDEARELDQQYDFNLLIETA